MGLQLIGMQLASYDWLAQLYADMPGLHGLAIGKVSVIMCIF